MLNEQLKRRNTRSLKLQQQQQASPAWYLQNHEPTNNCQRLIWTTKRSVSSLSGGTTSLTTSAVTTRVQYPTMQIISQSAEKGCSENIYLSLHNLRAVSYRSRLLWIPVEWRRRRSLHWRRRWEKKGPTQALCSGSRCPAQLSDEILVQRARWMGFRLAISP
jgi:hypothetical protein